MKYQFNRLFGGGYLSKRKSSVLKNSLGFTLIELLVVIAIIGILASVVLASLSSARDKTKIIAIKSNLKNLQSQAEIYYSDNGTYTGLCNLNNSVIHPSIQPFIDSLKTIAGATNVKCFVHSASSPFYYAEDVTQDRNFAVAVVFSNVHYAVDKTGVVTFDTANNTSQGVTANWSNAQLACANSGKRLPSMEQLKAVWNIYGTNGPAGFTASIYWSTFHSPTITDRAYFVYFDNGYISSYYVTHGAYVRCVS